MSVKPLVLLVLLACAGIACSPPGDNTSAFQDVGGPRPLQRWLIGPGQDLLIDDDVIAGLGDSSATWQQTRQWAWRLNEAALPRFQTWYGRDEILAMLGWLRRTQPLPTIAYDDSAIDRAFSWLLERGVQAAQDDPESATALATATRDDPLARHGLSGLSRVLFSPWLTRQLIKRAPLIASCLDQWENHRRSDPRPRDACFQLPIDARSAVVKMRWMPLNQQLPEYETSRAALASQYRAGEWQPSSWLTVNESDDDPTRQTLFLQRISPGQVFALVAVHLVVKVSVDWHWQTLWWSKDGADDFGSDAVYSDPASLEFPLRQFKTCAVQGFTTSIESSVQTVTRSTEIDAIYQDLTIARGSRSWCSNPYLETGPGAARTNCVGCHQHAGTEADPDRILKYPSLFPDDASSRLLPQSNFDYLWSLTSGGQLAYGMRQIMRQP